MRNMCVSGLESKIKRGLGDESGADCLTSAKFRRTTYFQDKTNSTFAPPRRQWCNSLRPSMLLRRTLSPAPSSSSSLSACTTSSDFSWSSSSFTSSYSGSLPSSSATSDWRANRSCQRRGRSCKRLVFQNMPRRRSWERRREKETNRVKRREFRCQPNGGTWMYGKPPTRSLKIEFWVRTAECKKVKTKHLEYLDRCTYSREQFIEDTVFTCPFTGQQRDVVLEPNMFPYDIPLDIEHWTLWSRRDLSEKELSEFVEGWVVENRPHVVEWEYDDNAGNRSIHWYHVHVFFRLDHPNNAFKRVHDPGSKYSEEYRAAEVVWREEGGKIHA
ncbi:unnamed protein product [Choristocarpus tenellus]